MEIELGLRLSRPNNDAISTNLRIIKDGSNPLFLSIETNSMFILTANLKGYPREKLKIDINEDGTQITISGEKVVTQAKAMHKREAEVRRFSKVFRIPDRVVLDGINARFNEEESVLKIFMPKSVKGISGVGIEEVKDEEIDRGSHERTGVVADEVKGRLPQGEPQEVTEAIPKKEGADIRMAHPEEKPTPSIQREVPSSQEATARKDSDLEAKSRAIEGSVHEENGGVQTHRSQPQSNAEIQEVAQAQLKPKQVVQTESPKPDHPEEVQGMGNEIPAVDDRKGSLAPSRKSKLCSPCFFAGSAILVSIVVLVIHFSRTKKR